MHYNLLKFNLLFVWISFCRTAIILLDEHSIPICRFARMGLLKYDL